MAPERRPRLLASADVSTLVPAPPGAGEGAPAPASRPHSSVALRRDMIAGLTVAVALVALVFLTSSSIDQTVTGDNTWSEIVITFLGAGACAAAVLIGGRGRAWGAPSVAIFAAFTAYAALSILWSVQPDWSWFGANQLLSYLAAFAGAVALARMAPRRWPALVGAVATAAAVLCAWALLAKVFPTTLAPSNEYGRLLAPFGYWNAIGVCAALGLAPALWAATRAASPTLLRALTIPAMTLMISVIALSFSRSAALVGVVAVAAWAAFVPLRLRTRADARPRRAVRGADRRRGAPQPQPHHRPHPPPGPGRRRPRVRPGAAGRDGGRAGGRPRGEPCDAARQRSRNRSAAGWGPSSSSRVALVPVAGVAALAASSRGLFGQISHAWQSLVSTHSVVFDTPGRITELGSSRPVYWHQALDVGSHALLKGVGELGYGIARLRYTTSTAQDRPGAQLPVPDVRGPGHHRRRADAGAARRRGAGPPRVRWP